jgi:hypothetical protein
MNLLVWRRSTIGLAIIFTLAIAAFQFLDARTAQDQYELIYDTSLQNVTYTADPDDAASFRRYGQRVAKVAAAAAMRDVALIRVYCNVANIGLSLLSSMMLAMALFKWNSYIRSRQFLMTAWFLAFAVPFAIATVPTRVFVNWTEFEDQSHTFMKGVAAHYELDEKETQVVSSCTLITDPSNPQTLEEARANVEYVCSTVDDWDGGFVNWMSGDAIARANENCRLAQEAINDGNVDLALELTGETCDDVLDTIDQAGEEDGNALKRMQIVMVTQELTTKARVAAELGISLMNALWAVKGMVPAAVAIAPAMLRGALTVKTLVPQSSIPGMFVILLPWLYCPLVWCIYNVAFQLTGTLVFFFGLLLLAFAPMSYVVLGHAWHITKPMDDSANKRMMNSMFYLNMVLLGVSGALCMTFAFGQEGEHRALAKRGIDEFLKGPMASTVLVVTTMGKYLLTNLAGVDFMVHEIAAQRDFEVFLETGVDRTRRGFVNSHKNILSGPDGRFRILSMMKQRTERLDDLCKANRRAIESSAGRDLTKKGSGGGGGAQEMVKHSVQKRPSVNAKGSKQYGAPPSRKSSNLI